MTKQTINDVARAATVSEETVSRVVEQVIAELGYVPNPQAQALAVGRALGTAPPAMRAAVIVLVHDGGNPPLALAAQEGVLEALRGARDAPVGHALVVHVLDRAAPEMEQDLRGFLEALRPAGVLLLPGLAELEAAVRACRDAGVRYVRMGATMLDEPARLVVSNDREAAAGAIGYLIALGHQRIGIVAGPDEPGPAQERELGYLDAMADHNLDRGPALIAGGDGSFASGVVAGGLLLEVSPRPTAIFAVGDAMAAGVLHAARVRGITVPGDISIVGFEDAPIAGQIWPPLTTVRLPAAAMGRSAALKLLHPDDAANQPSQFRLELVARASAGPPTGQSSIIAV